MPTEKRKDNGSSSKDAVGLYEKSILAGTPLIVCPKTPALRDIERLSSEEGSQDLEELKSLLATFVTGCPEGKPMLKWLEDQWDKNGEFSDLSDAERMMKFLKTEMSIIQANPVVLCRKSLLTTSRLAGLDSCRRPGSLGQ